MGKILVLICLLILGGIIWSLPLYLVVNLILWVFHISAHLTMLQAFALSLLITFLHSCLFGNGKGGNG